MNATITITDADRFVDYTLSVACDFLPGAPGRRGWLDGGHPGEAPAVEINRVRCIEIALWCGKYAVSALPAADPGRSLESKIGAWCLEKYREEIEQAVLETALARREAIHGPEDD
ncbi:MAG: hypothetical protein ACM3U2_20730 [Deltaproteobacteria bacterium]